MNPQNNNSQLPNSINQNQQSQYSIAGTGNPNQMQNGSSIGNPNGVTPSEREAMLSKIGAFLQNSNSVPKDKIATVARNLESQSFQNSSSKQQYILSCSNILNQLTNSLLQKNLNPQQQFQQGNQHNTINSNPNLQIPNPRSFPFPLHQGQNIQAQQLQKQMQLGANMQIPQPFSNTLQPDQVNELQRRKALAQMQNLGLAVPNQGNFTGNSLLQGSLNAPSLGRPRPAQQPMQSAAGNPGGNPGVNLVQNLGISSAGPQFRPGVGSQPSQITPQMINAFAQSPAFPAFASSRGLTLLQAKNVLLEQANAVNNANAPGANQLSNSVSKADSTPNLVNNSMNPNHQATSGLPSRPGLINPAFNASNLSNQKIDRVSGNPSQLATASNPSLDHLNNPQLQTSSQANILAQKQKEAIEVAKSDTSTNPASNLPPGTNQDSFKLTPSIAFKTEEILNQSVLRAIEVAKVDLEPKLKSAVESFKTANVVAVSTEDRAQIMEFLQNSPLMIKTIDVLVPIVYLIKKNLELPKLLVFFKYMICEQLKVLPSIILALNIAQKISFQLFKANELVREHMARFLKDAPALAPTSVSENISNTGHSTNIPLSNPDNKVSQVIPVPQNPNSSSAPHVGATSTESSQAILPGIHNKTNVLSIPNSQLPEHAQANGNETSSGPAHDFKYHVPNSDLNLKLPQKSAPKANEIGLKNHLQASQFNSSPLKPLVKDDRSNQTASTDSQVAHIGSKRPKSLYTVSGLKPDVSAQLLSSEKEIALTRSQFKGQALAYAASAFKELNASRQDSSFKRSKNSSGDFKIHITPDLYHYDLPESIESSSFFSFSNYRQGPGIQGFGDLIPKSKQTS